MTNINISTKEIKATQSDVAIRIAKFINLRNDLLSTGVSLNYASNITHALRGINDTKLIKVIEIINQLKPK